LFGVAFCFLFFSKGVIGEGRRKKEEEKKRRRRVPEDPL